MAAKNVLAVNDGPDINLSSKEQLLQNNGSKCKTNKYFYAMDYEEGGVAVIINNKKFLRYTNLKERKGTAVDFDRIKNLLSNVGFEPIEHHDCTVSQMEKVLSDASEMDFSKKSCFVCVILSYGQEDVVDGTDDRRIKIEQLIQYFNGDQCKSLAGKPKVFIIQTCPHEYREIQGGIVAQCGYEKMLDMKIPVGSDILQVHSCVPGSLVWNENGQESSIFIDSLAGAFSEWKNHDILTILTRMSKRVARRMLSEFKDTSFRLPYLTSSLTRQLCFPMN